MSANNPIQIAYCTGYSHPLPPGHRFPMVKYELIPEQLLHEGTISKNNIFQPLPCPKDVILLTHTKDYYDKLTKEELTPSEQRRIGFPFSQELFLRELIITQGTIDCCKYAFQKGIALNVAGGTHHAYADKGEGFCIFNDQAVAANYLLNKGLAKRILIIDLDVHQGNGTASIFNHDPRVYTFSMHGGHNYPFHKEKSDKDIPLPDGIEDKEYLQILESAMGSLFDSVKPDFCFYQAGVDILSTDKFGKMNISIEGCKKRDQMVYTFCQNRKVPCVVSMGGGYSPDIRHIVEAHCNTFRLAFSMFD